MEVKNTTNLIVFHDSKSHKPFFPFSLLASLAMTTTVPFLLSPRVLEVDYVVGRIYKKIISCFESITACGLWALVYKNERIRGFSSVYNVEKGYQKTESLRIVMNLWHPDDLDLDHV